MADNLTTQSGAPSTPPAGTLIATRQVTYSGDGSEHIAPMGLVTFSGADDAKTATDVGPANPLPVALVAKASGGATPYHKVAASSNNAASIKGSAGTVYEIDVFNIASLNYPIYVKLYDKAIAPSPAADTPVKVIGVQVGTHHPVSIPVGLAFANGIGIAIVKGIADNDNTAVNAGDCVVDVSYT